MTRHPHSTRWFGALPAALTIFLGACSSGSGGGAPPVLDEDEPALNDAFDDDGVVALTLGRAGHGQLDTETDVDYWSIDLTQGSTVSVELFGARLDQAAWDDGDSIPRVTIYDSDGTTVAVNHDFALWSWGKHDLDHPLLLVPATGTYYASVAADGGSVTNGPYALRVNLVNVGALQLEAGDVGGDNDTFTNAEPVVPGTIYGFHDDDDADYFSFEITTPSVVRFELVDFRNGIFESDDGYHFPRLELYGANGTTALAVNDQAYFNDPAIDFWFDTPGVYFINVFEEGGDGDAPYFLTYSRAPAGGATESEPNDSFATADAIGYGGSITGTFVPPALVGTPDSDYVTFHGAAGDMVRIQRFDSNNSFSGLDVGVQLFGPDEVTALDWGGDEGLQTLSTILQESGPHYLLISGFDVSGSEYRFELTRFRTATPESEPNDGFEDADALGVRSAGVIDGVVLGGPVDTDTFSFSAAVDRLTTISIYASTGGTGSDGFDNVSGHGSDLEPTLRILDAEGVPIASSTSDWLTVNTESVTNGLPCVAVSFIPSESGTFHVEVTDAFDNGGSSFYYVIERTN